MSSWLSFSLFCVTNSWCYQWPVLCLMKCRKQVLTNKSIARIQLQLKVVVPGSGKAIIL